MGGGSWSADRYRSVSSSTVHDHGTVFAYDKAVKSGAATTVHPDLDPKGLKVRESRDSATSPTSRAVAVFYDVTGSMGDIPRMMQPKFPGLMGLLVAGGYIQFPHLMISAIGDATCDNYPLQVGQFEIEADKIVSMLSNMIIESGGGGQMTESYELALYIAARKTSIDCYEKRGDKGFLFTIGDEMPYDRVKRSEVSELIGDTLQADIPIKTIADEVAEKYHHFHIIPTQSATGRQPEVVRKWRELLGERVILMEDASTVAEIMAGTIAMVEGVAHSKVVNDLSSAGLNVSPSVSTSLAAVKAGAITKHGTATGLSTNPDKKVPTL